MSRSEPPTPVARRMVQRRGRYFLTGAVLLVLAAAALVWGVTQDVVGGLLLSAFLMVAGLFAIVVPVMNGLAVRDFDRFGRVRKPVAAWAWIAQTLCGGGMAALVLGSALTDGFDGERTTSLVVAVLFMLLGLSGVISVWREKETA